MNNRKKEHFFFTEYVYSVKQRLNLALFYSPLQLRVLMVNFIAFTLYINIFNSMTLVFWCTEQAILQEAIKLNGYEVKPGSGRRVQSWTRRKAMCCISAAFRE